MVRLLSHRRQHGWTCPQPRTPLACWVSASFTSVQLLSSAIPDNKKEKEKEKQRDENRKEQEIGYFRVRNNERE